MSIIFAEPGSECPRGFVDASTGRWVRRSEVAVLHRDWFGCSGGFFVTVQAGSPQKKPVAAETSEYLLDNDGRSTRRSSSPIWVAMAAPVSRTFLWPDRGCLDGPLAGGRPMSAHLQGGFVLLPAPPFQKR